MWFWKISPASLYPRLARLELLVPRLHRRSLLKLIKIDPDINEIIAQIHRKEPTGSSPA